MSLTNARYYARGRFFWDERAETLEARVLAPIQDPIEMGLPLEALEEKLRAAPWRCTPRICTTADSRRSVR